MRMRWVVMLVVLAVILVVMLAPMASVMIAGSIADSHGCVLHEGAVNPCIVDGKDIGETLYTMGMMGWLMIATIPIGAIALLGWVVVAIILLVTGRRKPTPPPADAI
ncbi:MAG: hypothetical protein KDJ86_12065 [Bauldia sp.]|uniref:hypothetical protein n=1 Tax=Bauldia sp. TaxID=2575872 RepID=UPI001D91DDBB|nr:hypothetical protein [Bauldia sp.]MCB1496516.1 hypothetical protein [Bauldia sp.]